MRRAFPTRAPSGYIIVLALVFAALFATVAAALVGHVLSYTHAERVTVARTQALAIAEGALDLAINQLNQDPSYSGQAETTLGNGTFTVTTATIDSQTKRVTATGYVPNRAVPTAVRAVQANIGVTNSVVSFHYGIQSGNGGLTLHNSSTVTGNVFSGGSVIGDGGNYVYGDVISSGSSGLVYGIHATSSVYAHTIGNAAASTVVDKNAYYASALTNTMVAGTLFPNSPDQATTSLPISDAQIENWENQAALGGTATCSGETYSISSGTVTLGPVKIPCDLSVSNSATVIINGHLWVTGTITVQNSAVVKMASALGAKNVAIIADNPSNRSTSSIISVKNSATFQGSGTPGSFVFLISQNNSAETGGETAAFSLGNSASALVAYAAHGLIPLGNSVSLKEVTAYQITLSNSANVTYDAGLPNAIFQSGPGASWTFVPGTYAITR